VSGIETRLTHKPVAIIDPFSVISANIFPNKTKNAENNYSLNSDCKLHIRL
jgi:hypothetical protein